VLAAAGAVTLAAQWILMPWGFYLGGSLHPYPGWQGTATVHASSGDYVLTIWMYPTGRSRLSGNPTFTGNARLCTPRGERFALRLYASMLEHAGRDTNGKPMQIDLRERQPFWSTTGSAARPRLTLRGKWENPDLVMSDGGTLSVAFLPDGRLYDGPGRNLPHARETLPVVFHGLPWTTMTWGGDGCR